MFLYNKEMQTHESSDKMQYFRIRQDCREVPPTWIKGIFALSSGNKILNGDVSLLPKSLALPVEPRLNNNYGDVLSEQVFMVKENLFDLLMAWHINMDYRMLFLTDLDNDKLEFYYIPLLPLIECISEKSENNLDKSVVKKTVIKYSTGYPDIFRIKNIQDKIVVVSLPLAEFILRQNPKGVLFEEIEIDDEVSL